MGDLISFLSTIGQEVEDADEESFLLFSQDIPSSNLGFVDSKASTVQITVHEREYTVHQSPTLLSSSRAGGTTGAVLWKITPLFASWVSNTTNPFWTDNVLTSASTIVELGCGISALTALALSPLLEPESNGDGHYIATDQEYVHRLFRQNLQSNPPKPQRTQASSNQGRKGKRGQKASASSSIQGDTAHSHSNITFTALDWETDHPETLKAQVVREGGQQEETDDPGFDLLLSCDCIYNEALIAPYVRTCAEIARLRPSPSTSTGIGTARKPTVCVVAQQQRSPDVFEAWLRETMRYFRVYRLNDDVLGESLGVGSGYLVHGLVLKD
ncbi:hypothetical protein AN6013.2 [Aspergillus nidulans FGSC A4]|uniref:Diaminohydroxyphosphoribosylamino-pyrimidine deaminase n=1 Tax=Emericella nidulans (strain FGSC A4 / ATCC 38163 / CBS 112.46 / NRRL 194 / M139) TaxID=227321 RepID=Q5B0B7_EMENI|nr:S-adenosylmethionine-dependent RMK5p-like methyltransferase [Aspergillus nidulans FGSC A4]EAA57654.1 hypothetical protein AN6013.2 [Aspergillus nidulans FGSC A4]CBF70364.1 TPA: conserved hypothetical protein [Aspergillus nidulans FGSC A4]|eukprot:XP_663617.1 hypothetical protein AN6013.2 [Aspergillus nidulans FGSC A4]